MRFASLVQIANATSHIRQNVGPEIFEPLTLFLLRLGGYVQERVGHKSSKTADIYTSVAMKDLKRIESPLDLMSNGNGCGKMIENVEKWMCEVGFGCNADMGGYANLSSYMNELSEIAI